MQIQEPSPSFVNRGVSIDGTLTVGSTTTLSFSSTGSKMNVIIVSGGITGSAGSSSTFDTVDVSSSASVVINPSTLTLSNVSITGGTFNMQTTNAITFTGNVQLRSQATLNSISISTSSNVTLIPTTSITLQNIAFTTATSVLHLVNGTVNANTVTIGSGTLSIDRTSLSCTNFQMSASTVFQFYFYADSAPIVVSSTGDYSGSVSIFVQFSWSGANYSLINATASTGTGFSSINASPTFYSSITGSAKVGNNMVIFANIPSTTPPSTTPPTTTPPSTTSPTTTSPTTSTPSTNLPATGTSDPTATTAPATGTSISSTNPPATGTSAPATGTSAPATGTSAPATGTSAPATGTSAPSTGTSAPVTSSPSTGNPSTGNPSTQSPVDFGPYNGTYTVDQQKCVSSGACCCFVGTQSDLVKVTQIGNQVNLVANVQGTCSGLVNITGTANPDNSGSFFFDNRTYNIKKNGKVVTVENSSNNKCNFKLICFEGNCNSSTRVFFSFFLLFVLFVFFSI